MYVKSSTWGIMFLTLYVNDILLAGKSLTLSLFQWPKNDDEMEIMNSVPNGSIMENLM